MCARECVRDLRDLATRTPRGPGSGPSTDREPFPPVLFFTMSAREATREFMKKHAAPGARAICDPEKFFYSAFGLERGGLAAFLSPRAVAAVLRALAKGNGVGKIDGDAREMSGFFLVRGDRIVRRHLSRHVGDHPDWEEFSAGRVRE